MNEEYLKKEQRKEPNVTYYKEASAVTEGVAERNQNIWLCDSMGTYEYNNETYLAVPTYANQTFHDAINYGIKADSYYNGVDWYLCLCNYNGKWGFGIVWNKRFLIAGTDNKETWEWIRDGFNNDWNGIFVQIQYDPSVEPSCNECDEYHTIKRYVTINSGVLNAIEKIDKQFGDPVPQDYIDEEEEARQQLLD